MSTIESYEYYSACPQCGAANVGNEKCDYCGASLIKSKTNANVTILSNRDEREQINLEEDAYYPEIKGKLFEKDEFLFIFCPIFGGIFLLVPTVILIVFSSTGIMEPWVFAMLALFWIVGIGGIYPIINYFITKAKCKNGREVRGIVRGYQESMVLINGRPALSIRLLVDQYTDPKILVLSTGTTTREHPIGKELKLRGYKNKFVIEQARLQ